MPATAAAAAAVAAAPTADSSTAFDLGELDLTTTEIDFSEVAAALRALEHGDDLGQRARSIGSELANVEQACVEEYVREADGVAALHGQIKSCDAILATMENM